MEDLKKLLSGDAGEAELEQAIARLDGAIEKMSERLDKNAESSKKMAVISKGVRKQLIISMVIISVFLLSLTLCTYAYFTSNTASSGNVIATGSASVTLHNLTASLPDAEDESIPIMPGQSFEKSVYAENTGVYPVYVRARITSVVTLDERYAEHQGEVDLSLLSYDIDLANWTEQDGYYYYNTELGFLQSTTNLLRSVSFSEDMGNIYKDSTVKVTILLETVQARGNGDSALTASGWISTGEGGAP